MLDPYGRVGKLNVHSLFEEMTAALQTTENKSLSSRRTGYVNHAIEMR